VRGDPFWGTVEIVEVPDLIDAALKSMEYGRSPHVGH
jgi:hypothetical protein